MEHNQNLKQRMPAEWEPQAAIWLSWPHNVETWPENLSAAQAEFVAFALTIANHQPVKVLAGNCLEVAADQLLTKSKDSRHPIELIDIPTNDAWARDYAPTFTVVTEIASGQRSLSAVNWHYNAWGGKYPPFDDDQAVAAEIAKHLNIPCHSPELCFEGGALEVNQSGTMLTTRSCALDPNRNPNRTVAELETIFKRVLGVDTIVWLPGDAIPGDDTDGHIDQLARFTDDHTIVFATCSSDDMSQKMALEQNIQGLTAGLRSPKSLADDPEFRFVPLPNPPAIKMFGRRIPASYCNFVIANGIVVVPQFGATEFDKQAIQILKPLFPSRIVVGLPSLNLSVGLGSFHCLSQQQPSLSSEDRQQFAPD